MDTAAAYNSDAPSSQVMFLSLDKMRCRDKVDLIPPTLWTAFKYLQSTQQKGF